MTLNVIVKEKQKEEGFEKGLIFAMEKVCEYPDSVELLHSVAIMLQGLTIMTECLMEQKETCDAYITQLYERVAKSNDSKFSDSAKYMLFQN